MCLIDMAHRNRKNICLNVIYAVIFGFILICTGVTVYWCVEKFNKRSTYYDSFETQLNFKLLPAITVCSNLNRGYRGKIGNVYTGLRGQQVNWNGTDDDMTPRQYFESVTFKFEELVWGIQVVLRDSGEVTLMNDTTPLNTDWLKVTKQVARVGGKCYTMTAADRTNNIKRPSMIRIFSIEKLNVYVHNLDAFQDVEMRRLITTEKTPLPNLHLVQFERRYRLENQYDFYRSSWYTCGVGNYSYDYECVYKKLADLSTNRTCTTPWVLSNTTKICESEEDVAKSFKEYNSIVQYERHSCKTSCRQMPISTTNVGKDEYAVEQTKKYSVTLQFERMVTLNDQAPLYDGISLMAEMGGYVGVLCGYSILSLINFLYEVFDKKVV